MLDDGRRRGAHAARPAPASSCSRRSRHAGRRGCGVSASSPTRSHRAPCGSAGCAGSATSTGASCCRIMPTGRICCRRSPRSARRRVLATHGYPEPLARYLERRGSRAASSGQPGRRRGGLAGLNARFAPLFAELDQTTRPMRRSPRWCVFCRRAPRRSRMGGILPERAPTEAPAAVVRRSATWTLAATELDRWILEECWSSR